MAGQKPAPALVVYTAIGIVRLKYLRHVAVPHRKATHEASQVNATERPQALPQETSA